jgi:hypothetical protein
MNQNVINAHTHTHITTIKPLFDITQYANLKLFFLCCVAFARYYWFYIRRACIETGTFYLNNKGYNNDLYLVLNAVKNIFIYTK